LKIRPVQIVGSLLVLTYANFAICLLLLIANLRLIIRVVKEDIVMKSVTNHVVISLRKISARIAAKMAYVNDVELNSNWVSSKSFLGIQFVKDVVKQLTR
jgi:hypothetical protein